MKKIVLGIAAAAMLTSSLMAASADRHVGVNYIDNNGDTDYGVNFGMDKLLNPVASLSGFGVGAGFDIDLNTLGSDNSTSNFTYGGDIKGLVGYSFKGQGVPVNLKAGVGYDFTVLTSDSYMSGLMYTASVGYDFSDSYGIEGVYRGGDMTLHTAFSDTSGYNKTAYTLNFVWRH